MLYISAFTYKDNILKYITEVVVCSIDNSLHYSFGA